MIKNILQIIGVIIIAIFIIGGIILGAVGTTIALKEIEAVNETVATGIYLIFYGLYSYAIGYGIIKLLTED